MKVKNFILVGSLFVSTLIVASCADSSKKKVDSTQPRPEEVVVTGMKVVKANAPSNAITAMSAPAPAVEYRRNQVMKDYVGNYGQSPSVNTENYQTLSENSFKITEKEPVSTFSIDVDTGAYANVRRFLKQGVLPPKDSVRVEELINYFPYKNTSKNLNHPFSVKTEVAPAPWNADHQLLRIRVQAMEAEVKKIPASNLVFLVDVSGSMNSPDKLPLVKNTLKMLTQQLRAQDRISLIVYAGRTQVELESTPGDQHEKILAAIERLSAGGSTAGESAIKLAYQQARANFIPQGINRILLATDGDFNVGISNVDQLKDLIAQERKSGVSLTTLGFGEGNYNEYLMEQIADVGNGNYAYVDSADEGRKVLVEEMASTFNTVAADVKLQVEFNPQQIAEYRLLGYENRLLKEEDFKNDKVDAGEIGSGKTVTAIYELTPVGKPGSIDPHRYQDTEKKTSTNLADELAYLKIRYKNPGAEKSIEMQLPILKSTAKTNLNQASEDFRFAASVAGFGMSLRDSHYFSNYSIDQLCQLAQSGLGEDQGGYRAEFIRLMKIAKELQPKKVEVPVAQ